MQRFGTRQAEGSVSSDNDAAESDNNDDDEGKQDCLLWYMKHMERSVFDQQAR